MGTAPVYDKYHNTTWASKGFDGDLEVREAIRGPDHAKTGT